MECERLQKLIKNWYLQVQDESMAPARMVDFMRSHAEDCLTCMGDPDVDREIARITEIVLPPSKIPKAVRREEAKQNVGSEVASEAPSEVGSEDEEATTDDVDEDTEHDEDEDVEEPNPDEDDKV